VKFKSLLLCQKLEKLKKYLVQLLHLVEKRNLPYGFMVGAIEEVGFGNA